MISAEELVTLISKVGGQMADAEAKALIHAADKDGNQGIDFSEFAKFWEALHGDDEVLSFNQLVRHRFKTTCRERSEPSLESWTPTTVASSPEVVNQCLFDCREIFLSDEMVAVISSEFQGDKASNQSVLIE